MTYQTPGVVDGDPIELKDGEPDPADVVTKALDDLRASVDERIGDIETKATDAAKLGDRLDKIEARMNRPTPGDADKPDDIERKAFGTYLRLGNQAPADELKTLVVSGDPQGGYLAPAEVSNEFIRDLVEFSPIRPLASVRTTGAPSVSYPRRTGITNAKWKGETQESEGSEPGFGQIDVTIREVNTFVDISNQLLADSASAEAEVRLALAEDFGAKEGLAFVKGAGVLEPEGIMSNPDVLSTPGGDASSIGGNFADVLITHLYSLPPAYRSRGIWLMNGTTLGTIRKLTNEAGEYLWHASFAAGQPETILGRPVIEIPDMDDVANDKAPILFGDIATAYRIVDRVALSILVNPYTRATEGITRIHATRRVGAAVVQPKAVRKIVFAAT